MMFANDKAYQDYIKKYGSATGGGGERGPGSKPLANPMPATKPLANPMGAKPRGSDPFPAPSSMPPFGKYPDSRDMPRVGGYPDRRVPSDRRPPAPSMPLVGRRPNPLTVDTRPNPPVLGVGRRPNPLTVDTRPMPMENRPMPMEAMPTGGPLRPSSGPFPAPQNTGGLRGAMGGAMPAPMSPAGPKLMKKGGSVKSSASKRGDGCAVRGKTKGRMV